MQSQIFPSINQFGSFQDFLREHEGLDNEACQAYGDVFKSLLPEFLLINFGVEIEELDDEGVKDILRRIADDPVLREENRNMIDANYTSVLARYRRFLKTQQSMPYDNTPQSNNEEVPEKPDRIIYEGDEVQDMHATRYERSPEARQQCIDFFKAKHGGKIVCECCGFDFSEAYREIGEDFIEVHHRFPVSQRGRYKVRPELDLVPLCSNCHSMIHRIGGRGDCMTVDDLRDNYLLKKADE